MKALSVRGDYIMDMIAGKKKIEYRSWQTNYRGPLLMCSTAKKVAGAAPGYALCVVNLKSIEYSSFNQYREGTIQDRGGICKTLLVRDYKDPKCVRVVNHERTDTNSRPSLLQV